MGPRPVPIDVAACEVDKLGMSAYAGDIDGARAACQTEAEERQQAIDAWDAWQAQAGWIDQTAQDASGQVNEAGLDFLYNCLFENAAKGPEAAQRICMGVALDTADFKPGQAGTSCPSPSPGAVAPSTLAREGAIFALLTRGDCPGDGAEPLVTAENCMVLAIERGMDFAEAVERCSNAAPQQTAAAQPEPRPGSQQGSGPPQVAQPQGQTQSNADRCAQLAAELERIFGDELGNALGPALTLFGGLGGPSGSPEASANSARVEARLNEIAAEMQRLGCPGMR
jgi:hypothetical protein